MGLVINLFIEHLWLIVKHLCLMCWFLDAPPIGEEAGGLFALLCALIGKVEKGERILVCVCVWVFFWRIALLVNYSWDSFIVMSVSRVCLRWADEISFRIKNCLWECHLNGLLSKLVSVHSNNYSPMIIFARQQKSKRLKWLLRYLPCVHSATILNTFIPIYLMLSAA